MAEKVKVSLTAEMKTKLNHMGKKAAYEFLEFLKTGNKEHLDAFWEVARTEISEGKKAGWFPTFSNAFVSVLKVQAPNDPGLKDFVNAYEEKYGKINARKLVKATEELFFDLKTLGESEKKYGKGITYTFVNLVTWRLAAHAANLSLEAFEPGKVSKIQKELEQIADMEVLGIALAEHNHFIITYDKQLTKKIGSVEGLAELWDSYEANVGVEEATMRGLLMEVQACADLLRSEGKKSAEEEYGADFVEGVTKVTKLTYKKPKIAKKEYTQEELMEMLDDGKLLELVAYLKLTEEPIGKKMEKESSRIKFIQQVFNDMLLKNKEFLEFLKTKKFKKFVKKGKKMEVDGNYPTLRPYLVALGAFLKLKAKESEFKATIVDAKAYPANLSLGKKKSKQFNGDDFKAMATYLGIELSTAEIELLSKQEKELSTAEKEFYETNLKSWLEVKEEEGYLVPKLTAMLDYLTEQVRDGKVKAPITNKWLDGRLGTFEEKGLIVRKELTLFKPSEISSAILAGEGVADALNILIIGKKPISTSTKPKVEGVRISTVELILDAIREDVETYIPEAYSEHAEKIKGIKIEINGKFEGEESNSVKAIQDFLFEYAKENDEFLDVLKEIGVDYLKLKATGRFDEQTAKTLAAYIAYTKGTWEDEKEALLKPPEIEEAEVEEAETKKPKSKFILFR